MNRPLQKIAYVNKADCTSCHLCTEELPLVFRMDEEELAEVFNPYGADEEAIGEAIDSCPGECIHWHREEED